MEQILIRNLPPGTKASLRRLASQHGHSMEAEARELLESALRTSTGSIVDALSMPPDDIEFEPTRLGLTGRPVEW